MMMPWQVILPCLVTMLLVVASFLLPPTAGEKILVNSACFIGETVLSSIISSNNNPTTVDIFPLVAVCVLYLLHFQSVLPAMSDHIPLIVLFYR